MVNKGSDLLQENIVDSYIEGETSEIMPITVHEPVYDEGVGNLSVGLRRKEDPSRVDDILDTLKKVGKVTPERIGETVFIHEIAGNVDDPIQEADEMFLMHLDHEDDIHNRTGLSRWDATSRENVHNALRDGKILGIRGLFPQANLETFLYNLPDEAGNLSGKVILAGELSPLSRIKDLDMRLAVKYLRAEQYDWDDPNESSFMTVVESWARRKIPNSAARSIAGMPLAPAIALPQLAARGIPFLSKVRFPLGSTVNMAIEKTESRMPNRARRVASQVSNFPYRQSRDFDLQHAVLGLKLRELHARLVAAGEDPGTPVALFPDYEFRARGVLNDTDAEQDVIRYAVKQYLGYYEEILASRNQRMTPEMRNNALNTFAHYLGRTEVVTIKNPRVTEGITVLNKHLHREPNLFSTLVMQAVHSAGKELDEDEKRKYVGK